MRFPKTFTILLCFLQCVSSSTIAHAASSFPDLVHTWYGYKDSIAVLVDRGIINGYPDGTFGPKTPINRAEFLKLVFAAKSHIEPSASECFADISADAWFGPYVCAAKRRGMINGYSDGTFRPGQVVNTAEAIKILLLAYGRTINEPRGEHWYEPYTQLLQNDHILVRSSYVPSDPLTRERAADLLVRVLKYDEDHVTMQNSPGCGTPVSYQPTTVMVNGEQRTYLLTAPAKYSMSTPMPLIIAFHGRTNSNEQVRKYFGLEKSATEFLIAYPAALKNANGSYTWSDGTDKNSELRDVAFFDALVKQLGDRYCVDMNRIFVVGHSLGAWFANSVACIRGGVVRGSATVGGSSVFTNCAGPSAAMIINNPKDTSSPQGEALRTRDQRLRANGCSQASRPVPSSTLSCIAYTECDGGNTVQWCPHTIDHERDGTYYPHVWPPDAAKTITSFFRRM